MSPSIRAFVREGLRDQGLGPNDPLARTVGTILLPGANWLCRRARGFEESDPGFGDVLFVEDSDSLALCVRELCAHSSFPDVSLVDRLHGHRGGIRHEQFF